MGEYHNSRRDLPITFRTPNPRCIWNVGLLASRSCIRARNAVPLLNNNHTRKQHYETKLLAIAATALLATGCASTNISQSAAPLEAGFKPVQFNADVSVGEKISGHANSTVILGFITLGDTKYADGVSYSGVSGSPAAMFEFGPVASTKAAAAYKAVNSSNADIIVNPRYVVDSVDYVLFKKIDATVTGSKGTITKLSQSHD